MSYGDGLWRWVMVMSLDAMSDGFNNSKQTWNEEYDVTTDRHDIGIWNGTRNTI